MYKIIILSLAALLFCQGPLMADPEAGQAEAIGEALSEAAAPQFRQKLKEAVTEEPEEEKYDWEWDTFTRYMPSCDLKAQGGSISLSDTESELSYTYKIAGKLPIEFSLNSEYIDINDKGVTDVSLPSHLTGIGFGIQGTFPTFIKDNLYLRLKVQPSFLSQNWNMKSSSFRIPSFAYLIYQPNDKWTFIAGVAGYPGYETPVFPIAGFIYKPNDKLEFSIVPSEPSVSYSFNKMLTAFINGGASGGEFRVTKDGYKGAVLQYNEAHAGGGLQFSFGENIDLIVSSGYMFSRSLKYRDSLGKVSIENGMYSEFRLEMRI